MSIWTDNTFPTLEANLHNYTTWAGKGRSLTGKSDHWKAKNRKPFCWTPTRPFWFGDREFLALYPCIAFETRDAGYVIQKLWDGMRFGRE